MAQKMCFIVDDQNIFLEEIVEFVYIKGMAFSQKQKNVKSFHGAIAKKFPQKRILEVSTKSDNELGIALSAFNLKLNGKSLESSYQAAKVFENGEQYSFLIDYAPKDAHKFIAEHNSGKLKSFRYNNIVFPLEPKTLFYDYIYITALLEIPHISKELVEYDIFTDIEFNEKRQINCQARACAIYSYLLRTKTVDKYLKSLSNFKNLYLCETKQMTLFDL